MSHYPEDYLGHIVLEADFILRESQSLGKDDFLQNEILKRAIVRSLEIIGEATKHLPDDFRQQYPQIPWKRMAGMRDKLIHDYMGVDYEVVWNVVTHQIPDLRQQLERLLQDLAIKP